MARGGMARKVTTAPAVTTGLVTAEAVAEWIGGARPGDEMVYFQGSMALQSIPAVAAARALHDSGKVMLYQQRTGPAQFKYCMRKRAPEPKKPRRGSSDVSGMEADCRELLRVLSRLANRDEPCPSNSRLAELADLWDAESARYRLNLLVQGGHIDIATPIEGPRVITIRETGAKTRGGR